MPLFADHLKNARVVTEKGLALTIDKMNVKEDTFSEAMDQIVNNKR